jgi:hypothetical protein
VAKLLDALPALVGGIDHAIFKESGKTLPFVLLVFTEGGAMHATNINPPVQAIEAIKELAAKWDTDTPTPHVRN